MKTKYEVSTASIKRFYAKYLDADVTSENCLMRLIDEWKKEENFSKYSEPLRCLMLYAYEEKLPAFAFALGTAMAGHIYALENDKQNVLSAIDTLLTFHGANS